MNENLPGNSGGIAGWFNSILGAASSAYSANQQAAAANANAKAETAKAKALAALTQYGPYIIGGIVVIVLAVVLFRGRK
jgi:hypothetical protein